MSLSIQLVTEDTVPALGTTGLEHMTWSTASGFKGLENDAVIVVGIKDVEKEWSRGIVRTTLHRFSRDGSRSLASDPHVPYLYKADRVSQRLAR